MCENLKKIAFVSNTSFSIYNFRMGVIRELSRYYHVTIIAPQDTYSDFFKEEGIRYIPVEMDSKGTNIFKDLSLLKRLYSLYKKEAFDLIFHYTIKPVIYGSLVSGLIGTRNISVITGLGYTFQKKGLLNRFVKLLYRFSLNRTEQVWFLNNDDQKIFLSADILNKGCDTLVLDGEGVDTSYFAPVKKTRDDGTFKFLLFSRLLKDKGVVEFVRAGRKVRDVYPNVKLFLLGSTNDAIDEYVASSKISRWVERGDVEYLGEALDVRPFLADADCVVLPSYYKEGVPRCLMEAMAMEKPIITTDNVGCIELIKDGDNGFVCRQKDVEDLADKMMKMCCLPSDKLSEMGKIGREIILARFEESVVIRQYKNRIDKIFSDEG